MNGYNHEHDHEHNTFMDVHDNDTITATITDTITDTMEVDLSSQFDKSISIFTSYIDESIENTAIRILPPELIRIIKFYLHTELRYSLYDKTSWANIKYIIYESLLFCAEATYSILMKMHEIDISHFYPNYDMSKLDIYKWISYDYVLINGTRKKVWYISNETTNYESFSSVILDILYMYDSWLYDTSNHISKYTGNIEDTLRMKNIVYIYNTIYYLFAIEYHDEDIE